MFDFLKHFSQISRFVASFRASKRVKPPPAPGKTESLTFGNKFCKIFSHYEFLFQRVFTPRFKQRHIPRYNYIKRQQQKKNPRGIDKSNGPWTKKKNCEFFLFPTADRLFDRKVKCPTDHSCFGARFLQKSRLITKVFILEFWQGWVLLPCRRGWLKTRVKRWFVII